MRDFGGRDAAGGDLTLLVACMVVALVAFALPRPWAEGLVSGIRSTFLAPVVALRTRAELDRTSRFELDAIAAARDSLALRVQRDSTLITENAALRGLLELPPRLEGRWASAEVLHQPSPTDPHALLLSAGAEAGVSVNDPVVTADGLLGVIAGAGPRASTAMTWQHPDFRVSATTGTGQVLGIVGPVTVGRSGEALLELRGVALRDTVPTGALIVTSGLGGVYPRGIPLGRVVGVSTDPLGYEQLYRIVPFANPGSTAHVMVLLAPRSPAYLRPIAVDSVP
jgi:rod shape-determining protein MreC